MRTPSVHWASEVAGWGIMARLPASSGTCRQCDASGSSYAHLDFVEFQVGHIIYQKHFSGTNAPPVAHSSTAQV